MISIEEFDKLDLRIGTVLSAKRNRKSRDPAFVMAVDFGAETGVRKTSAQITDLYTPDDLIGRQVVCCVNLKPIYIGSVKSEMRVLAAQTARGFVLIRALKRMENDAVIR
ncbi:MAG: tRNA-binding protein [Clostridiales bacterium]|nr:tRNA-binding protein [Clostridiales bacterium]